MLLTDLFEASLPLIPNEIPKVRGSYGAFVLTMHPEDFLRLTASPDDRSRIEATPFPEQSREDFYDPANFGRFPLPFLTVQWPTGLVLGHEGRHRALMVLRQGGKNFPVAIYLRAQSFVTVTYTKEDETTGEVTDHAEEFTNGAEASELVNRLKANIEPDVYYWKVRTENRRGGETLKGSPSFIDLEDPWKKKAFTVEDMPKSLVSQYDPSITVSDYRVGLVKGYRHFRA